MKLPRLLLLAAWLVLASGLSAAETPKDKSPADLAYEAFNKFASDREAKIDAARLEKIRGDGFAFLLEHGGHSRAVNVIGLLIGVPGSLLRDKSQQAQREGWVARLKYEVINRRMTPGLSDEGRTALASMEAAIAAADFRSAPSRQALADFREKIDKVAGMPGASRFLSGHERDYIQYLGQVSPDQAAAYATTLLEHRDKKVAGAAREELNLIEVRRTPVELAIPSLEGGAVDWAKTRGKTVVLYFWQTGDAGAVQEFTALRDLMREYKLAVEIFTVCCNAEAERAAVVKFVKDHKVKLPVLFDGQGRSGPALAKLNIRSTPMAHVFDKRGILSEVNQKTSRLEGIIKKQAGIK